MVRKLFGLVLTVLVFPSPAPTRGDGDIAPASKYEALVDVLRPWIAKEVKTKQLPALSIALVDDQKIVWSHGFGFTDPRHKTAATADTVYRVGSVSKPFTTLLLMMLVEMGLIDLDAPVQKYLPDFQPVNK